MSKLSYALRRRYRHEYLPIQMLNSNFKFRICMERLATTLNVFVCVGLSFKSVDLDMVYLNVVLILFYFIYAIFILN